MASPSVHGSGAGWRCRRPRGVRGAADDLGDRLVGQVREVAVRDDLPLLVRQRVHGGEQHGIRHLVNVLGDRFVR
jgi:hypothetical protein